MKKIVTAGEVAMRQHDRGFRPHDQRTHIMIKNARDVLWRELQSELGDDAQWLPEYDEVAAWLTDNQGKGLLCMGDCGRGKTLITNRILPRLFQRIGKVLHIHTAIELLDHYSEISPYKHICIDDMGTEPDAKRFGESHNYISELIDLAERKEKLLIISTNLNKEEILQRYDLRTFDRLRSLCMRVVFKGESLRR